MVKSKAIPAGQVGGVTQAPVAKSHCWPAAQLGQVTPGGHAAHVGQVGHGVGVGQVVGGGQSWPGVTQTHWPLPPL